MRSDFKPDMRTVQCFKVGINLCFSSAFNVDVLLKGIFSVFYTKNASNEFLYMSISIGPYFLEITMPFVMKEINLAVNVSGIFYQSL